MTNKIRLDLLSDRQAKAWVMRYQYGWRGMRIARELGISAPAVTKLLQTAQRRAGIAEPRKISVIRCKPRLMKPHFIRERLDF